MKTAIPDRAHLELNVADVHHSDANPRQEANEEALEALTESVRQCGVLQPIVVRPADGADGFEIICGHRRHAAAVRAGLEVVPAIVRHVDPAEAFDIAMAENLQREDLTAMDEAQAYFEWQDRGLSAPEIAAKVGRPVSHVYLRLKLLDLPEIAQEALRDGRLSLAIAGLLGRLPGARQREEATKRVLDFVRIVERRPADEGGPIKEPMSFQAARRMITEGYMLALADAPFDVNDRELVPAAGSCADCHHRSGNQIDLFGDVVAEGGADVCTYPTCYVSKREARADAAVAGTGLKRLSLVDMDKTFQPGGNRLAFNSKWVDADAPAAYGRTGKKSIRKALGDAAPKEFVAIDGTGQERRLFRAKDVKAALEVAKPEEPTRETTADRYYRLDDATRHAIHDVIVARGRTPESIDIERLARALAAKVLSDSPFAPHESHGVTTEGLGTSEILKNTKTLGTEILIVLMAEASFGEMVDEAVEGFLSAWDTALWSELEKIYGFKLDAVRKMAGARLDEADSAAIRRAAAAGDELGDQVPDPDAAPIGPPKSKAKPKKTVKKKVVKKARAKK